MSVNTHSLTTPALPAALLQILQAALQNNLLQDVESLASGMERAGWRRNTHGGWWTCFHDPAWTLCSTVDPADFSVFATGTDALVRTTADQVTSHLRSAMHGLTGGERDEHGVRTWTNSEVRVDLYFSPTHTISTPHGDIEMPCFLQVAVSRQDASPHGRPTDHQRSRRLAREGSAVQRWYLADQEDLPEDVVHVLALDEDPAVVAALEVGVDLRKMWRRRVAEEGVEEA